MIDNDAQAGKPDNEAQGTNEPLTPTEMQFWLLNLPEYGDETVGLGPRQLLASVNRWGIIVDVDTVYLACLEATNILVNDADPGDEKYNHYSTDVLTLRAKVMREKRLSLYNPADPAFWKSHLPKFIRRGIDPYDLINRGIAGSFLQVAASEALSKGALLAGIELAVPLPKEIKAKDEIIEKRDEMPVIDEPVSLVPYQELLLAIPDSVDKWYEKAQAKKKSSKRSPTIDLSDRSINIGKGEQQDYVDLGACIYAGTLGSAYVAKYKGRACFVKILDPSEVQRQEFEREIAILTSVARGEHARHFPRIINSGSTNLNIDRGTYDVDTFQVLVEEAVLGIPMPNMVSRLREMMTPLEGELVVTGWIGQVLDILDAVHEAGVAMIERKTSDFIVQRDGNIVALDWNTQGKISDLDTYFELHQLGSLWIQTLSHEAIMYDKGFFTFRDRKEDKLAISFAGRYIIEKLMLLGQGVGQRYHMFEHVRRDLAKYISVLTMDQEVIESLLNSPENEAEELMLLDMLQRKYKTTTPKQDERITELQAKHESNIDCQIQIAEEYRHGFDNLENECAVQELPSFLSSTFKAVYDGEFEKASRTVQIDIGDGRLDANNQVVIALSRMVAFDFDFPELFDGGRFERLYKEYGEVEGYRKVRELQRDLAKFLIISYGDREFSDELVEELFDKYPTMTGSFAQIGVVSARNNVGES